MASLTQFVSSRPRDSLKTFSMIWQTRCIAIAKNVGYNCDGHISILFVDCLQSISLRRIVNTVRLEKITLGTNRTRTMKEMGREGKGRDGTGRDGTDGPDAGARRFSS